MGRATPGGNRSNRLLALNNYGVLVRVLVISLPAWRAIPTASGRAGRVVEAEEIIIRVHKGGQFPIGVHLKRADEMNPLGFQEIDHLFNGPGLERNDGPAGGGIVLGFIFPVQGQALAADLEFRPFNLSEQQIEPQHVLIEL